MAINIKELFVTDLNPNSGAWWSADKVDKINYNFNQFSNGGAPGPQGTIGVDGGFGPMGAQGATGGKGPQGYQGPIGTESLNDWVYLSEGAGFPGYLYPRKNPITDEQTAPVALRIGYLSTDSEWLVGVDPYSIGASPVQIVKTNPDTAIQDPSDNWVNLRVEDNSAFEGYNFKFKPNVNGNPSFEISPDNADVKFRIICAAQTIVLKTGPSTDSITIDSSITINTGGENGPVFNLGDNYIDTSTKITVSEQEFIFTPEAAIDKVLVSTDVNGNVAWKNVKDVFGTFPIGSIISIRPEEFTTDHFWLNDSINVTQGSPLNNIYGRGKVNTDYEGWYLCNGETWETVDGFNQYLTPNLNNFSYTISANGDAQIYIAELEQEQQSPILIGGYDMQVYAVPDLDGVYYINYNNQFLDNDTSTEISGIDINFSSLGLYDTSRMIHIVYLENTNLKWSNTGADIPPVTTVPITLTQPAFRDWLTCSLDPSTNYSWNGPGVDWNTFTVPSTIYKLFNTGTTMYAPSGWYTNLYGYPIYWNSNIGRFTLRGTTCTI